MPGDECVHGHTFDEANTYVRRDRNGRTSRQCRRCKADREAGRKARMDDGQRGILNARQTMRRRLVNGWRPKPWRSAVMPDGRRRRVAG